MKDFEEQKARMQAKTRVHRSGQKHMPELKQLPANVQSIPRPPNVDDMVKAKSFIEQIDELDCAIMSGDHLTSMSNREMLSQFIMRWIREIARYNTNQPDYQISVINGPSMINLGSPSRVSLDANIQAALGFMDLSNASAMTIPSTDGAHILIGKED